MSTPVMSMITWPEGAEGLQPRSGNRTRVELHTHSAGKQELAQRPQLVHTWMLVPALAGSTPAFASANGSPASKDEGICANMVSLTNQQLLPVQRICLPGGAGSLQTNNAAQIA